MPSLFGGDFTGKGKAGDVGDYAKAASAFLSTSKLLSAQSLPPAVRGELSVSVKNESVEALLLVTW